MTQTFTENVHVNGSADVTQLQVKGHTTQTQPLQAWQDSGGNTLARVTPDGRLQQGNLGLGTPAALVEANDSITLPSSKPKRAWHALGRISGALTDAVAWVVHELELLGSGGTSGIHTALRAKLTHNNTGSATSAELRAGDFQTVNQSGTSGARVGQIKGLRSAASNGPNAYLNKAVGIEATITNDAGGNVTDAVAFDVAAPNNAGTLANLYGVRVPTFSGLAGVSTDFASAQFEDDVELKLQSAMPVKNPPANFIKLYTRLVGGMPKLYGKDSAGVERELGGGGTATDEKAKVSSNDTTPGYLSGKLVAGSGITLTENNNGADETLTIAATGVSASVPTGSIALWTTDTPPSGWLLCAGQAVSRTTYSALFALLGTAYGTGDGTTTFNVPDLRGRFPLGKDNMGGASANRVTAAQADNLGQGAGTETHILTVNEMPSHAHAVSGSEPNSPWNTITINSGTTSRASGTGNTGGGQAHNNMPPYLTLDYVIKT